MVALNTVSASEAHSGTVLGPRSFGRYLSRRFSIVARISSTFSKATSETAGADSIVSDPSSHILIVSLSYGGRTAIPELCGTKYDFCLMLKRCGYLHDDNSGRITLLNDFAVIFKDAAGVTKVIPKADTSPRTIKKAIQKVVRKATAGSQVLFYFGGHGEEMRDAASLQPSQAIIAGNGERISGQKLHSWLTAGVNPGVSVTAVFDACSSAGILGLSYQYEYCVEGVQIDRVSDRNAPVTVVEIAAARRGQEAFSKRFAGSYHGQLTWSLGQYYNDTKCPTIEGLVRHMHTECADGEQLPQVSCSREMKGQLQFTF